MDIGTQREPEATANKKQVLLSCDLKSTSKQGEIIFS